MKLPLRRAQQRPGQPKPRPRSAKIRALIEHDKEVQLQRLRDFWAVEESAVKAVEKKLEAVVAPRRSQPVSRQIQRRLY